MTIVCNKCGVEKPKSEYSPNRRICKKCKCAYSKAYKKLPHAAEAHRQRSLRYHYEHRDSEMAKMKKRYHYDKEATRFKMQVKRYGITEEQFYSMLNKQSGCCAVCGTGKPGNRNWHIDHDHNTGVVRGLLCGPCNTGIGHLKDSIVVLEKAAAYLRQFQLSGN